MAFVEYDEVLPGDLLIADGLRAVALNATYDSRDIQPLLPSEGYCVRHRVWYLVLPPNTNGGSANSDIQSGFRIITKSDWKKQDEAGIGQEYVSRAEQKQTSDLLLTMALWDSCSRTIRERSDPRIREHNQSLVNLVREAMAEVKAIDAYRCNPE